MLLIVRYLVFALVALAALAALLAMLVQQRLLNPFGRPARLLRDLTDPLVKPIERRVLRAGGNPQNAPWWMLGIALVGGILTVTAADWVSGEARLVMSAAQNGGRSLAFVLVSWALGLLELALLVRVVGSWMGIGPYSRWMRPVYLLTEWFLAPLRRVLPPFGPLDLSPFIAWLILELFLRPVILGWL